MPRPIDLGIFNEGPLRQLSTSPPEAFVEAGSLTQPAAAPGGAGLPAPPTSGRKPVPFQDRPTIQVDEAMAAALGINPGVYVRDGTNAYPLEAVRAAGGDFNAVPQELSLHGQTGRRVGWQGLKNYQIGGGGGGGAFGSGNWAQIGQAAGLQGIQRGWTRGDNPVFQLAQDLGRGHTRFGANGTFVSQRPNGWVVYDNAGNVVQQGAGTAPQELFDPTAQAAFEANARDAIIGVGGNLAARLQGALPQPPQGGAWAGGGAATARQRPTGPIFSGPPQVTPAPTPTTRPPVPAQKPPIGGGPLPPTPAPAILPQPPTTQPPSIDFSKTLKQGAPGTAAPIKLGGLKGLLPKLP